MSTDAPFPRDAVPVISISFEDAIAAFRELHAAAPASGITESDMAEACA